MSTVPKFTPETNRVYAKGSLERFQLEAAIADLRKNIPFKINITSAEYEQEPQIEHVNPAEHATVVVSFPASSQARVSQAVVSALKAKENWSTLPFRHRAAVFLRAGDLIVAKFRSKLTAALILSQGFDARQAEVIVSELIDLLRLNVELAEKFYAIQPQIHAPGVWNTNTYSPLEGFVVVKTSSESLSNTGNSIAAAVLLGNAVLWAPANAAVLSSHIFIEALLEAGLPQDVIQFIPGASPETVKAIVGNSEMGAIAFAGSLHEYVQLQSTILEGVSSGLYLAQPRFIADTDGHNCHIIHPVCDLPKAVSNTLRAALEYQGQKSNSISSVFVPSSISKAFVAQVKASVEKLSVGPTITWKNFVGPVLDAITLNKLSAILEAAKEDEELELLYGGQIDDSVGYFLHPTIYTTRITSHPLLFSKVPIRGPILVIGIYDDESTPVEQAWLSLLSHVKTKSCSSRSSSIFASERKDISLGVSALEKFTGNLYINTRCNASQVGQSFYGGGRFGGTGEKVGTVGFLERFANVTSLKEELLGGYHVIYASHVE